MTDLQYIADGEERILTVDATSVLGDPAKLADTLADHYRWSPSEAATFALTGRQPEVLVYTGSVSIRHHSQVATTRVTMHLDPSLTPQQVAAIYGRLKAKLQSERSNSLSVKHYRLAEHVGPYVATSVHNPRDVRRQGRPPKPGPTGLAQFVDPLEGHSWRSLRRSWNSRYGKPAEGQERTWQYDSDSNFIRDAKDALDHLLQPRWEWQPHHAASKISGDVGEPSDEVR
ncbi:hypothetical protein [Embleya sp. NPDC059259]|uniref:hypothetical protein n=1 Tax=unclassified Embleya TaxID=2699296 RepID=UPI0036BFBADF